MTGDLAPAGHLPSAPAVLSVVMINRHGDPTMTREAVEALGRELLPDDEVVWVDRTEAGPPHDARTAEARWREVLAEPTASRGRCYALGLAAASGPLVAFTDSTTIVQGGWRAAAFDAVSSCPVVGGPVLPSEPKSRRDWAGFLVDYAAHAVPPYRSATGDVSGNNVAYRRESLPSDAAELWKSQVNAGLAGRGVGACAVAGMCVRSARPYTWGDLVLGRARSGALYGTQRCLTWSRPRRLAAATGCLVLPAVAVGRTGRLLAHDRKLATRLAASLPVVLVAQIAWAIGEATGYLSRRGEGTDVW